MQTQIRPDHRRALACRATLLLALAAALCSACASPPGSLSKLALRVAKERDAALLLANRVLVVPTCGTPANAGANHEAAIETPERGQLKFRADLSRIAAESLANELREVGVERGLFDKRRSADARPLHAVFVAEDGANVQSEARKKKTDSTIYVSIMATSGEATTLSAGTTIEIKRTIRFQSGSQKILWTRSGTISLTLNEAGPADEMESILRKASAMFGTLGTSPR